MSKICTDCSVFSSDCLGLPGRRAGPILMYKKSIYLGQPDTELTSNQVNGLANQTRLQGSW